MRDKIARANNIFTGLLLAASAFAAPPLRAAEPAQAPKAPAVGTKAPDFTLDSQEGLPVSLSEFKGVWVALYFYPKDFTSGCALEARGFERDLKLYEEKKAVVIGVSAQSSESHKEFCAKESLDFRLLADVTHAVSSAYGSLQGAGEDALSARNTFLIDPEGNIAKEFLGVEPGGHSREVLAALAALQK